MKTKMILCFSRGWVLVGDVEHHSPREWEIHSPAVVRLWGTTAGLGQLAFEGPTAETRLDHEPGPQRFDPLLLVRPPIPCVEAAWKGVLRGEP